MLGFRHLAHPVKFVFTAAELGLSLREIVSNFVPFSLGNAQLFTAVIEFIHEHVCFLFKLACLLNRILLEV